MSDMIKYGVNPSEIGDETILTDEDLRKTLVRERAQKNIDRINQATKRRRSSKKHRPYKSSNKKEKE